MSCWYSGPLSPNSRFDNARVTRAAASALASNAPEIRIARNNWSTARPSPAEAEISPGTTDFNSGANFLIASDRSVEASVQIALSDGPTSGHVATLPGG